MNLSSWALVLVSPQNLFSLNWALRQQLRLILEDHFVYNGMKSSLGFWRSFADCLVHSDNRILYNSFRDFQSNPSWYNRIRNLVTNLLVGKQSTKNPKECRRKRSSTTMIHWNFIQIRPALKKLMAQAEKPFSTWIWENRGQQLSTELPEWNWLIRIRLSIHLVLFSGNSFPCLNHVTSSFNDAIVVGTIKDICNLESDGVGLYHFPWFIPSRIKNLPSTFSWLALSHLRFLHPGSLSILSIGSKASKCSTKARSIVCPMNLFLPLQWAACTI